MDWIYNALFKAPNAHTLKPLLIHSSLIQVGGNSSLWQNHFMIWSFKKKNHVNCCVVLCRLLFKLSNAEYVRIGFPLWLNINGFLFLLFYIWNKNKQCLFICFTNTSLEKQFAKVFFTLNLRISIDWYGMWLKENLKKYFFKKRKHK